MVHGQARKSLWIETFLMKHHAVMLFGQARKSLWIETEIGLFDPYIDKWSGS